MIESIEDFRNNLKEVDVLMSYSRANQKSIVKFKLFNKTAIVLLCSYFEVFIEAFISEHVDTLKLHYDSGSIPQYMKDNYIDDTLKALRDLPYPSRKPKKLKALFKLHDSSPTRITEISDLELDIKYAFGKHGQEDTARLLKKFGFKSFVESDDFLEPFKSINSAISIRNNVIHEGCAPTLSYQDLVTYKKEFEKFASGLEQHLLANQIMYYGATVYA